MHNTKKINENERRYLIIRTVFNLLFFLIVFLIFILNANDIVIKNLPDLFNGSKKILFYDYLILLFFLFLSVYIFIKFILFASDLKSGMVITIEGRLEIKKSLPWLPVITFFLTSIPNGTYTFYIQGDKYSVSYNDFLRFNKGDLVEITLGVKSESVISIKKS